jgi:hypothetical protein
VEPDIADLASDGPEAAELARREDQRHARAAAERAIRALTGWLNTTGAAPAPRPGRQLYLFRCLLLAATDSPVPAAGTEELIASAITFAGRTQPPVTPAELLELLTAIFHSNPGGAQAAPNGPAKAGAAEDAGTGWVTPQAKPGGRAGGTR